ncbi:MAG: hypothetical protein ACREBC_07130, partial [Pyrinomonadaceae bacterium]
MKNVVRVRIGFHFVVSLCLLILVLNLVALVTFWGYLYVFLESLVLIVYEDCRVRHFADHSHSSFAWCFQKSVKEVEEKCFSKIAFGGRNNLNHKGTKAQRHQKQKSFNSLCVSVLCA